MKERNYGIDLLKVLLAFMVITIHIYANGTGQVLNNSTVQPWKVLATIITFLCYPAVNAYILITGYYSYSAKKELSGVIKGLSMLWFSVLFFSLAGYLIGILYGNTFEVVELIKRFFPIIRGTWWFYTDYFALLLLSPFINKLIDSLDQFGHSMLLCIMLICLSILPVFVNWEDRLGSNYGYSLIWFITLYITGAFINRRRLLENTSNKRFIRMLFAFLVLTGTLLIVPKILKYIGFNVTFAMYNSIIVYGQAIALFIGFANINISNSIGKIISKISGLALASYLLHCQEDIERIIWREINPSMYANSPQIVLIIIVMCLSIFAMGVILEFVRKKICRVLKVDKFFSSLVNCGYLKIESFIKRKV